MSSEIVTCFKRLIDLFAASNAPVSIQVKISALVNGKAQEKSFSLPLDKGARLKPAEFVSTRRITVSKIENLFGPTLSSTQF